MKKQSKLVLIAGNGRSGTLTMTHALKTGLGLDIGHEYVRGDGCCSLYFFGRVSKPYPYIPWGPPKGLNAHVGQKFTDFKFENIFHVVRDPLKCIASMAMIYSRPIMDWFEEVKLVRKGLSPRLHKAMHIWYETNKRVELLTYERFQIEKVEKYWPKMCDILGYDRVPYPDVGVKHKASGSRKRVITWDDLYKYDADLTENIRIMARRYGYK